MGLLNQILGGLAGGRGGAGLPGGMGGGGMAGGGLGGGPGGGLGGLGGLGGMVGGGRGGGINPMMLALLPIVLQMLSNRQRGGTGMAQPGGLPTGGGMAGGMGGGLGGLLERLGGRGYSAQAQSWVGTGHNEPLPPQAVDEVFDEQELSQIAQQAGLSREDTRQGLSQLLPEVVDDLTPDGQLPPEHQLNASLDDYARRLQSS